MCRIAVLLMLSLLAPVDGSDVAFYDDFSDGDISDWEQVSLPGAWWTTPGYVHGYTNNNCSGLLAPVSYELEDCTVSIRGEAVHVLGLVARVNESGIGLFAYVSPNYDVARIRRFTSSGTSTIYGSIYENFPSGVWYELSLFCQGDQLQLLIEVPATGDSWVLDAVDPAPQPGKFGLCMGDEPDASWDWISVIGAFGEASISWMTTIDVASGNDNMAFEAGEEIDLNIQLCNPGDEDLTGVFCILQSLSPELQITIDYDTFGTIPAGGTAWGDDGFGVFAPSGTPEDVVYDLRLSIFADGGYNEQIDFGMPLGSGISCDVESEVDSWTWGVVSDGWQDNWHVSVSRNHTPAGSQSFKCGDTGSGDYDNNLYAYLATPLFNTPLDGEMTFWMWIDAQYMLDGELAEIAYDGGLLQYGRCGTWIDLIPAGDYPYEIISGTTGPFEDGIGVFSGIAGWTEWTVTIPDSLAGPGQIRFVFGSDQSGTREGWHIDDIDVMGSTGVGSSPGSPIPGLRLQIWPNPFSGSITVTVTGVPEGPLSVEVFDLSGRLVASPEFGSTGSERSLLWDGRGNDGSEVPSGVYLMRLSGSEDLVQRIVRLK